ncbi:hypothetical protein D3C71_2050030 [compost metagenome]
MMPALLFSAPERSKSIPLALTCPPPLLSMPRPVIQTLPVAYIPPLRLLISAAALVTTTSPACAAMRPPSLNSPAKAWMPSPWAWIVPP